MQPHLPRRRVQTIDECKGNICSIDFAVVVVSHCLLFIIIAFAFADIILNQILLVIMIKK
jgi:hypothetical protein